MYVRERTACHHVCPSTGQCTARAHIFLGTHICPMLADLHMPTYALCLQICEAQARLSRCELYRDCLATSNIELKVCTHVSLEWV